MRRSLIGFVGMSCGFLIFLQLALFAPLSVHAQVSPPKPTVSYFNSLIDHFSDSPSSGGATFQQKILTCTDYWQQGNNQAVLFYTGNEGEIEDFYANTGQAFEWGAKLNALVVFVEHRYYGASLPFGNSSFSQANLKYLTIEQALEDYAVIIGNLQQQIPATASLPWIALGGSYGGVLSAWIRLRYPQLIAGAIAASAPIKYVAINDQIDYSYFQATTVDYQNYPGNQCADLIQQAFQQIQQMAADHQWSQIQQDLRLCQLPSVSTLTHVLLWARNGLLSLAQYDYPYPTDFEGNLPGFPLNLACDVVTNYTTLGLTLTEAFGQAAGLFYNGTDGTLPCFDTFAEFIECADQTGCGLGNDATAWDYQVCSQFTYLPSTNSVSDMFPVYKFDMNDMNNYCSKTYGILPNPQILGIDFGAGTDSILSESSNIVFSNGGLDPYRAGGFLPAANSSNYNGAHVQQVGIDQSITLILIDNGAHHLDLRASHPDDIPSVTSARQIEFNQILTWVKNYVPPSQATIVTEEDEAVEDATPAVAVPVVPAGPVTSIPKHARWAHLSRAAPAQPTSFTIVMKHGDREKIFSEFDTIFSPQNDRYLDYPSKEDLKKMAQPKPEALAAMDSWITSSVCTASRPSCTVSYTPYKEMATIKMNAGELEEFVQAHVHVFEHKYEAGKMTLAVDLPSLMHLVPTELRPHVAYTAGLQFPPEFQTHSSKLGGSFDKFDIQTVQEKREMASVATSAARKQELRKQIKERSEGALRTSAQYLTDNKQSFGDLPGSNPNLLAVARVSTGDLEINLELVLLYCSLSPLIFPSIDDSGNAYCTDTTGLNYYFSSMSATITDPSGKQTTASTSDLGYVGGYQPACQLNLKLDTNYIGYTLQITFTYGTYSTPQGLYPFAISGHNLIHPNFLRSYYNMTSDLSPMCGSTKLGIGTLVVQGGNGFYSFDDLKTFFKENGLDGPGDVEWLDISQPPESNDPSNPDGETQLDIQFGLGVMSSSFSPSTIYHVNSATPFEDICTTAMHADAVPTVLSFSYGGPEQGQVAPETIDQANAAFALLGLSGISVFVSSGDSGAFFIGDTLNSTCASFTPSYPGSSPYVTSVGASVLRASAPGQPYHSVQCSMEYGAGITGGGGFSTVQPLPDWQASVVNAWVNSKSCPKPKLYYNSSNRAYPDLVLFGHDYVTVTGGVDGRVDGTSASSPSFAGMFSLMMDLRVQAGMKPLGFLNRLLYQAAATTPGAFTDITEGSNRCMEFAQASGGCCSDAFTACSGYDPVTGLGSPNFEVLQRVFNVSMLNPVNINSDCTGAPKHKFPVIYIVAIAAGGVVLLALLCFAVRRCTAKKTQPLDSYYVDAGAIQGGGTYARMPE